MNFNYFGVHPFLLSNTRNMKKLLVIIAALFMAASANAQICHKHKKVHTTCCKSDSCAIVEKWLDSNVWRNGFTKASPAKQVDLMNFYHQYNKNQEQWNALFNWLQNTDLLSIEKGRYPIEGTSLVASVEDSSNGDLEKRRSESHRRKIDFQYVVKGIEGFALLDHKSSKEGKYDTKKDVIHYDYDKSKTNFFKSIPGSFNIFFPSDWHIAKVATEEKDQNIRVIVIKVDYKD